MPSLTNLEDHSLRLASNNKASEVPTPPNKQTWACLQDVLKARADSSSMRHMLFYSLGDVASTPKRVSYSLLYNEAKSLSLKIATLANFNEGSPVLLHLDDHWSTTLWFWAVLLADGIPVLSTPLSNIEDHRKSHLQYLSELLDSPFCITKATNLHLFEGSGHTLRLHTVESLLSAEAKEPGRLPVHIGASFASPWPTRRQEEKASPAILMLTSGSTGNAKVVPLMAKQIFAAVSGKASVRQLPADGAFLNWIGLDHVASLVEIHIQALWLGVDQIHVHAADVVASPQLFVELLSRHRVARSFAPNFFLAKLVAELDDDADTITSRAWDLSNLTVLASGGEANEVQACVAASGLLARYGARHDCITPGLGMTETCAGAIFNLECPRRDVFKGRVMASLGRCMPGIEMRIKSSTMGEEAVPGAPGHLELRGAVVFDGYYQNPTATDEAFTADGWFRTGDQAMIDEEGNLNLTGRSKDFININGVKIVTADIQASLDAALRNTCATRAVCFPSRPTGAATEQVTVAYIVTEWPPTAEEMTEVERLAVQTCMMVSAACSPFVFPVGTQTLPLLPLTTLGKISGAKMRVLFESGVFDEDAAYHRRIVNEFKQFHQESSADIVLSEAEAQIRADIAETQGIDDLAMVGIDTPIFELGFTSMDLIRLKHRIDTRLGFIVATIVLMKHPTVRSLAAALSTLEIEYSFRDDVLRDQPLIVEADYDPVVTLRSTGSKTPLWLVHPGVGEVLVFVGLAKHMEPDHRPVYALRARGFEPGQVKFGSIAEAVDTYVAEILHRQPQGPYALAGYSYGTMLAFEMAKKLETAGKEVRFLGSFNLPPHIKTRMRQLGWNICLLHLAQFLGLITEACVEQMSTDDPSYCDASRFDAMTQVLAIADESRMHELGLGVRELTRWADVAYGLQSMAVDYEPSGNVAVIDVFHAEPLKVAAPSRNEWVTDQLSKWNNFCRTEPHFHEVGGAHYTMIGPDYVSSFSKILRAALYSRGL